MKTSEKILILCKRKKITLTELAKLTNQSRQNLSNKLNRDNLTDSQIQDIAAALGCSSEVIFTDSATGEQL